LHAGHVGYPYGVVALYVGFRAVMALVKPALPHQLGQRPINALARPLFLAIFSKGQLVAENLNAAKNSSSATTA
jgi:hypothetical protein